MHYYIHTGSTLTPAATAFAVSIFSQLLLHSFQRIAELVVSAINAKHKSSATERPKESEITASLEYGKTIVNILLEHDVAMDAVKPAETKPEQKPEIESQRNTSKTVTAFATSVSRTAVVKSKKRQIVDRRRRRRGGGKQERLDSEEEEEEEGEESDSDSDSSSSYESLGRVSSDENLSMVAEGLGEDDLELLESLSDSSSSEEEEEEEKKPKLERKVAAEATPTTDANATKKAGKRHIILAANFNMPPTTSTSTITTSSSSSSSTEVLDQTTPKPAERSSVGGGGGGGTDRGHSKFLSYPLPSLSAKSPDHDGAERQLREVMQGTVFQTAVYIACKLVAEESSLMALRVFIHWLQSYPIVIATCTQVYKVCGG